MLRNEGIHRNVQTMYLNLKYDAKRFVPFMSRSISYRVIPPEQEWVNTWTILNQVQEITWNFCPTLMPCGISLNRLCPTCPRVPSKILTGDGHEASSKIPSFSVFDLWLKNVGRSNSLSSIIQYIILFVSFIIWQSEGKGLHVLPSLALNRK